MFNYSKVHKLDKVTEKILGYLTTAKIVFKVYGCEIIPEEKKTVSPTKKAEGVELDVEKAKREDLKKKQAIFSVDKESTSKQVVQGKPSPNKGSASISDPKRVSESTSRRQEAYKTQTSSTNNKITERNQKNAKDKDCIIY